MGCGCKNESQFVVENQEIENDRKNILEKKDLERRMTNFLLRKNKFSFFGLFLFLLTTPVVITFIIPITIIFLFNKFVFGRDANPLKLIIFTKNKKSKK